MTDYVYSRRKPSVPRMIIKLLLALIMGLYLWAGMLLMLEDAENASWSANEAFKVNSCDRYYYSRDYAGLYDELQLYDLFGENYDVYWEVVDGYNDYVVWQQWSHIAEEQIQGSEAQRLYYRDRVIANAHNCRNEKNRSALEEWKKLVEAAETDLPL